MPEGSGGSPAPRRGSKLNIRLAQGIGRLLLIGAFGLLFALSGCGKADQGASTEGREPTVSARDQADPPPTVHRAVRPVVKQKVSGPPHSRSKSRRAQRIRGAEGEHLPLDFGSRSGKQSENAREGQADPAEEVRHAVDGENDQSRETGESAESMARSGEKSSASNDVGSPASITAGQR